VLRNLTRQKCFQVGVAIAGPRKAVGEFLAMMNPRIAVSAWIKRGYLILIQRAIEGAVREGCCPALLPLSGFD
jgi:hypothetical protein